MLTKKRDGQASGRPLSTALAGVLGGAVDRRAFLRQSGIAAGGAALATTLPAGMIERAQAQTAGSPAPPAHADQERLHALLGRLHGHSRGR